MWVFNIFLIFFFNVQYKFRGVYQGGSRNLQTTFFLRFVKSEACRLPKNMAKACIPKCIFIWQKPADLNFEGPKPADQIFFKAKPVFLNKFLKVPVKHKIQFTSHVFPQQTHYRFYPSFIDPCLKVRKSLHLHMGKLQSLHTAF